MKKGYDLIIVGSGAAGAISAVIAARKGKKVLLLEKLSGLGAKLKATGGGRCNLTNTLANEEFMERFGRNGRFMMPALQAFDHRDLIGFFAGIGVESHAPDGYRVFPVTHNSSTIILALEKEMRRLGVEMLFLQRVEKLHHNGEKITGVGTTDHTFFAQNVIIATGGLGYPSLGAEGDGYALAESAGHKITELFPAMMPLRVKEEWVSSCRADTMAGVEIRIDLPKVKKLRIKGDLIFTTGGIRGPAILDFAREITPLLKKHGEVPLLVSLTKGMNEDEIYRHFKREIANDPGAAVLKHLRTLLPESVSRELCGLCQIDPNKHFGKLQGEQRARLVSMLAWTPLTVVGHDGFNKAMITRGGVSLKEINPDTMESRILKGLFFCGEVVDLDGPCGGYNLQWSFSSGFLAGHLGDRE